jgi:hypothetical protein
MSALTRTETEARPQPAQVEERRGEGPGSFGLAHLVACCVGGGAAVLAVILIEWLT